MDERTADLQDMMKTRGYVLDHHKVLMAETCRHQGAEWPPYRVLHRPAAPRPQDEGAGVHGGAHDAGRGEGPIKSHIEVAKREGATKENVLELLEMLVLPCGVPKFMTGYAAWTECFPVNRIEADAP